MKTYPDLNKSLMASKYLSAFADEANWNTWWNSGLLLYSAKALNVRLIKTKIKYIFIFYLLG